jgi:hypothetical protein
MGISVKTLSKTGEPGCLAAVELIAELESGLAPDPVRELEGIVAESREELTGITDIIRGGEPLETVE